MAKTAGGSGSGSGKYKAANNERSRLKAEENAYYQRNYGTTKKGYQSAMRQISRADAKARNK